MSRRLLDLCLLAYPRGPRRRDRDYLRDLALDLAERQGLGRQALSLLLGGLRERAFRTGKWSRRIAAASALGLALAFAAPTLAALARVTHESEGFACASVAPGGRGCATHARSVVGAQERAGWRCAPTDPLPNASGSASWQCNRDVW